MDRSHTMEDPAMVANDISGYDYGSSKVAKSPITVKELEQLKESAGFTKEDEHWLQVAGEVLKDQTQQLVEKWRGVISAHPHLARYSLRPDGQKNPRYSEASGLRFQQWVLDTCLRARYLLAPLRPGLAQLSAGNGAAARQCKEEQD